MRCRLSRHDPRPSRSVGVARRVAHPVRRVAGRRERGEHRSRGARVRARGERLRPPQEDAVRAPLPDDPLLAPQPLRRAGRHSGQPVLHQRPERRASTDLGRRVRRRLHGHRAGLRPGPALSQGRLAAEHRTRVARAFRERPGGARVRRGGYADAARPGRGGADDGPRVRRQRADSRQRRLGPRPVDRARVGRGAAGRPGMAAAGVPRPDGGGAFHPDDHAFLLAPGDAADAVLRSALARRSRQPCRVERCGRRVAVGRAGRQRDQRGGDGVLRGGHVDLRRVADSLRPGHRGGQFRRAAARVEVAAGC